MAQEWGLQESRVVGSGLANPLMSPEQGAPEGLVGGRDHAQVFRERNSRSKDVEARGTHIKEIACVYGQDQDIAYKQIGINNYNYYKYITKIQLDFIYQM